jgi:hypothetical protein
MSIAKDQNNITLSDELEALINKVVLITLAQSDVALTLTPFIRSKECARLLEVTPEHLCAMRARGDGPPWSGEGKWVRYERATVLAWIRNLPRQSAPICFSDTNTPPPHVERLESG